MLQLLCTIYLLSIDLHYAHCNSMEMLTGMQRKATLAIFILLIILQSLKSGVFHNHRIVTEGLWTCRLIVLAITNSPHLVLVLFILSAHTSQLGIWTSTGYAHQCCQEAQRLNSVIQMAGVHYNSHSSSRVQYNSYGKFWYLLIVPKLKH
jgi:hypothetical protein